MPWPRYNAGAHPTSVDRLLWHRREMNYRDLKAWQAAVDLSIVVFETVRVFPWREARDLSDQMRSAAVSVPSNIAEGIGRFSYRDQRQFMYRARGSLFELATQLEMARRLRFISPECAERIEKDVARVGQLLNGLVRYLSRQAKLEESGKGVKRLRPKKPPAVD